MTNKIIFSIVYFLAVLVVSAWCFNHVSPYLGLIIVFAAIFAAVKYYQKQIENSINQTEKEEKQKNEKL